MDAGMRALARRLADADPKAHELVRPQRLDDRAHAVVAGGRAAAPDAHAAQREVELVVDDPRLLRREARVLQGLRHRLSREIHVRLRQDEPRTARLRPAHQRLPTLAVDGRPEPPRELPHARETEVVARVAVLRLGVAESDDEPLFLFLLFHAGATRPAASAADPRPECTQTGALPKRAG